MNKPPKSPRYFAVLGALVIYIGIVASLLIFGLSLWGSYCEGFGCMGKGVAWVAWVFCYFFAFGLGYVTQCYCWGLGRKLMSCALVVQVMAGVALVIYWLAWRFA